MTHPRGQDQRRVLRGRRLGALLLASLPLGLGLVACADTSKVIVGDGTDAIAGASGGGSCGAGAVSCGARCCAAGQSCVADACVPSVPCTTSLDCSGDTTCGGSSCKAWSDYPPGQGRDLACRDVVDLPSLRPEIWCQWPGPVAPTKFPNSVQVIGTPMVIDFNYDQNPNTRFPSIVFISYERDLSEVNGVLRVINGKDCKEQFSYQDPDHPFVAEVSPALGDIDGDGRPDIVVADVERNGTSTRMGVAVFSTVGDRTTNFSLLGRQNSSLPTSDIKGLSIADVAEDNEVPEILTDTGIYAFKDKLSGIPEKSNNEGSALEPPIVRDVDGDQIAEMVTATGITNFNPETGNVEQKKARNQALWNQNQNVDAAFVGMADLGEFTTALGRDSAEMVIVSSGQLLVTQVDGRVLLRVEGTGVAGGPPVIADFDGDGRMEFATPGLDRLTLYDLDCVDDEDLNPDPRNCKNPSGPNPEGIVWQKVTHGAQSGASVFDFDGDRRAEVVYADQCYMRILNGLTGDVLFSVPRSSTTRWDYPVIADVDGDKHSEIVTASNDHATLNCPPQDPLNMLEQVSFAPSHGVTVWRDKDQRWAGSRPIWNQHTYSVSNVNDDGTIPLMRSIASQFTRPLEDPNTLRQNVQGATGVSLQRADLTTWIDPAPVCQMGNQAVAKISVNLCNRGLLDVAASSVNVALVRAGAPDALCTRGNTNLLPSGRCETITCDVAVPDTAPGFDIIAVGDSTGAVTECTEGRNNTAMLRNVFCLTIAR